YTIRTYLNNCPLAFFKPIIVERRIDVSLNQYELKSSNHTNTSHQYSFFDFVQKPTKIYVFIYPLCPECWSLEPYLKKLSIEYGRFFIIYPITTGNLSKLYKNQVDEPIKMKDKWERTAKRTDMSCDGHLWKENPISFPRVASLAIKAAELQRKKSGRVYLRKMQENSFLKKQ